MPFKTRAQKEAAIARRLKFAQDLLVKYEGGSLDRQQDFNWVQDGKSGDRQEHEIVEKLDYLAHDLLKIILAAGLVLGLQVILALTWQQLVLG